MTNEIPSAGVPSVAAAAQMQHLQAFLYGQRMNWQNVPPHNLQSSQNQTARLPASVQPSTPYQYPLHMMMPAQRDSLGGTKGDSSRGQCLPSTSSTHRTLPAPTLSETNSLLSRIATNSHKLISTMEAQKKHIESVANTVLAKEVEVSESMKHCEKTLKATQDSLGRFSALDPKVLSAELSGVISHGMSKLDTESTEIGRAVHGVSSVVSDLVRRNATLDKFCTQQFETITSQLKEVGQQQSVALQQVASVSESILFMQKSWLAALEESKRQCEEMGELLVGIRGLKRELGPLLDILPELQQLLQGRQLQDHPRPDFCEKYTVHPLSLTPAPTQTFNDSDCQKSVPSEYTDRVVSPLGCTNARQYVAAHAEKGKGYLDFVSDNMLEIPPKTGTLPIQGLANQASGVENLPTSTKEASYLSRRHTQRALTYTQHTLKKRKISQSDGSDEN